MMDGSIRSLLCNCQDENSPESVLKPYEQLKRHSCGSAKANVGSDLFVLCAEIACQHKKFEIAEDCIKMYFNLSPPGNQYLCRAYMCQAQIHAPTSTKNPDQIDKAVLYLLKAINFAKQNKRPFAFGDHVTYPPLKWAAVSKCCPGMERAGQVQQGFKRYYFLVFNASVLYWQFCRLFLKPNFKRFLAKTLHQVVKALDDIGDEDYEWRAQLMIALIECHVDAGRKDDASQIASTAAQFTRSNVPNLYKHVLGLQIQYRLAEYGKLSKETKSSPDLHIFFKIHRLKVQLEGDEKGDVTADLGKFYKQLTGITDSEVSGRSTEFSEKSSTNVARTSTPVAMERNDRLSLILELAKLCNAYGTCRLTTDCLDYVERNYKTNNSSKHARSLYVEKALSDPGLPDRKYIVSGLRSPWKLKQPEKNKRISIEL